MNAAEPVRVLDAGRGLDAGRDVDRPRVDRFDPGGDVLRASGRRRGSRGDRAPPARRRAPSPRPPPCPRAARARPCRAGGSRCGSARGPAGRRRRATRTALITFAPVRRAASAQNAGPSSPCSWRCESRSSSAARATSLERRVDEHADQLDAAAQGRGDAGGDVPGRPRAASCGQRMKPSAQAPSSTASSASSRRVMPQILTRVTPTQRRARVSAIAGELAAGGLDVGRAHQRLADQHGVDADPVELVELLAHRRSRTPTRRSCPPARRRAARRCARCRRRSRPGRGC